MRTLNLSYWKCYTSDKWILETVKGYKIEFSQLPFQNHVPKEIPFPKTQANLVTAEVQKLLSKGAIIMTKQSEAKFISTLFIVPKKDGTLRPVINLRYLNEFVQYNHFKQENLSFALDLIQKNDYLTKVDLKDAYFHIKIHPDFQQFLCFSWKGVLYKFVVLPFGLAPAPRVFTKVMKPVFATFRQNGIRCCFYIDDSLMMNQDYTKCKLENQTVVQELDNLGFTINESKSILTPTQKLEFFGVIIDTVQFKVFLTKEKIDKIKSLSSTILCSYKVTIRKLSSLIGLCIHAFNAITLAPLHYRALERDKVRNLEFAKQNYDAFMTPSNKSLQEITWWLKNVEKLNGKPIRTREIDVFIETDASTTGWGCYFEEKFVGGRWSVLESTNHINFLELLAVFLALKCFFVANTNECHVCIKSDNTSAVSYINNMGGMTSESMDDLTIQIWNWCTDRNIILSAQYLPGVLNTYADLMSRQFSESCEWSLKQDIFNRICVHFFKPNIDLFASRLNYKVENFASWNFDPEAQFTDAFSISWSDFQPYIFPPFCLISKVLNKIVQDNVSRAILIVPFWPSQTWFSVLISLLVSIPARIPQHKDLLTLPHSEEFHPLSKKMTLIACVVSGNVCFREEFQLTLPLSSHLHGGPPLINSTKFVGENGFFGVNNGRLISLHQLKQML